MKIVRSEPQYLEAVRAFNLRIKPGNTSFSLPEVVVEGPSYVGPKNSIRIEDWLALEAGVVRGGYRAVVQKMLLNGIAQDVSFLQQPLSEGLVDPKYNLAGFALVRHFQANYPLSYGLGMGGVTRPLPRMMQRLKWDVRLVPFFFYVCKASKFLRNISPLRTNKWRALGADMLALTGMGSVGIRSLHAWRGKFGESLRGVEITERSQFAPWADEIWQESGASHSFTSVFDSGTLDHVFPATDERLHRLEITRAGRKLGLLLLGDTDMRGNKYFGNMRVGSIIVALAPSEHRGVVAKAGIEFLSSRGVDLIVTNQQDKEWCAALTGAGFLQAQSNFAMALAPQTASDLLAVDPNCERVHLGRGNGDGPINL